jgi:hypothetical protein
MTPEKICGKPEKTKGRRKKILGLSLGLVGLIYVLYLFHLVSSFPPLKKEPAVIKKEIVGAYHLHTRFSDGRGRVEDVVKAARKNQLDFIILTDHGQPNLACLQSQGWRQGVLVLAGTEMSTSRGHLVGLAFSETVRNLPRQAEEAARIIQKEGGFTIIAHPYSKVSWSWGKENELYLGLELIDADTMLRKKWLPNLPLFPLLLFNKRIFALRMLEPFPLPFHQWDRLNEIAPPHYGFFSCDAHLFYETLLSLFHLHLPLERELPPEFKAAREIIFNSLQSGAFYNAIDSAQPASGFNFWAKKGEEFYPMGRLIKLKPGEKVRLYIRAPTFVAGRLVLIHNGQKILTTMEKEISFEPEASGFYRVEVYLQDKSILPENLPWIVSNPIFLRMDQDDAHSD